GSVSRASVCASMRSISASTSAISFNAAGDSVVLGCWACNVAMAPLTSIMMHAAAVHAFIGRDLASSAAGKSYRSSTRLAGPALASSREDFLPDAPGHTIRENPERMARSPVDLPVKTVHGRSLRTGGQDAAAFAVQQVHRRNVCSGSCVTSNA